MATERTTLRQQSGTALWSGIVLGGVVLLLALLAFVKRAQLKSQAGDNFEPVQAVEIESAREVRWRRTASLSGTAIAVRSVDVASEVDGQVETVGFDSGQTLNAGDVILTLESTAQLAELAAAEAAVSVGEADVKVVQTRLDLAKKNVQRVREAVEAKAASAAALDESDAGVAEWTASLEKMRAMVEEHKARVRQLQTAIAKRTLRAPFKAVAGMRTVHPGQYLSSGSTVVSLQGVTETIYLDFAVPQEESWRVKTGDIVEANAPSISPQPLRITVRAMDASADLRTRNVRVRGEVENPGGRIRPGMFVDVTVPIGDEQTFVAVPLTAVRRSTSGDSVFVVVPDEKDATALRSRERRVTLGPTIGTEVVVIDGLKVGERVATAGSFKLRDGGPVSAGPPPGAAGPPGSGGSR
jgi:membrane fusion protein (multidrug efflux system)